MTNSEGLSHNHATEGAMNAAERPDARIEQLKFVQARMDQLEMTLKQGNEHTLRTVDKPELLAVAIELNTSINSMLTALRAEEERLKKELNLSGDSAGHTLQ